MITEPIERVHTDPAERDTRTALVRGWSQACPACGAGRLYARYLKVVPGCGSCGEALHHHRADDAPPYFTMMIVGHVVIAGVLAVEQSWRPDLWLQMLAWTPLTILLSLWLLPRIKGAIVGYQWALRMHGFGGDGDREPLALPPMPAGHGTASEPAR